MGYAEIEALVQFVKEAEGLKSVTRTAWTEDGRRESTAEHSWRLALFMAAAADEFPEVDLKKALVMCLIHDLGERYDGDISAAACPDEQLKLDTERDAVKRVFSMLPKSKAEEMIAIWEEYNACKTPESKLVKALDKAETIIQHNQGKNPPDFEYAFNLNYGASYFREEESLCALRKLLDKETKQKILEASQLKDA